MQRKRPKKITPQYLERAAVFYLERYSSSAGNLRRVLDRKVRRSIQEHGTPEPAEAAGWIAALIEKLQRNGLLNDRSYAETKVRRLYAEGKALGRIRQTLAAKGVAKPDIDAALERLQIEADIPVSDLPAAISYARRRKLGPFRTDPAERSAMRQKDMGALARRGFSQAVTMTVLGAADQEALEELLHEQE
ncbi:MAG TPA: regulatory protein RecX [Ferrovibrio sp.]|jgi:regulatory protein|uniref:regulatory protein RecX n=1 Tax=Ferrovibrio sp. TaxID=1917215 RepID=UPI002B4ACD7D|nr:regulatory protein RecX [Ferrovibrio sp.]HLT77205.1 regulatory protein RecX [Ferrovibrio sp.]